MSVQNGEAEVLIDLTARPDVRKLGRKSELIQQQALGRLADLIIKRLNDPAILAPPTPDPEDIDADGSNILFDRRHDAIAIHGSRGSGKTTFIRNAFRLFRKDEEYREEIGAKVAMLGVVDPTLIENKENIFVVILNKIRRAVESHRNSVGDRVANSDHFTEWQKKLRGLAQGLALLDGIGPDRALGDSWDDVQYVLRKGLDKADAGSELETRFHDFVESSLTYIGKQAFLMALDDIDTDFQRGWPVLEVLRRYLTSPSFIVVLSGDIDLYALLVRGKQWEQFSKRQLNHDKTQEQGLREMVNHLQAQYLLKVLPPRNRIPLLPLSGMEKGIMVKLPARAGDPPEAAREMALNDCLREILRERLGLHSNAHRNAKALLLRQPVRTVVQVLSLLGAESGDRPWAPLAHSLPSIFLDSLLRHNTSLDDLYQATGNRTVGYVAKFLTSNRLWDNAQDLLPEHTEDDLNLTLLTVGAWVHGQCQEHPGLALEYMLRICFAHELLTNRLQTTRAVSRGSGRERDTVEEPVPLTDFVRFTELERHGSSVEVSRLFVSVINGEDMAGLRLGTVQTYKRGSRLRRDTVAQLYGRPIAPEDTISFATYGPSEESLVRPYYEAARQAFQESALGDTSALGNWYNTIDTLQARLTSETMRALVGLPTCRILKPSGERPTFVSVHSIIAGISELLRRAADGNEDGLVRTLRDALNIRSYPVPPWMAKRTVGSDAEQSDDWESLDDEADVMAIRSDPLVQDIRSWVQVAKNVRPPPPYVLARVWSRFYFTLAAIDEEVDRKDRLLGYLLHRQIVAFFNALLVEEMIYKGVDGVNLRNPVTSDRVFMHNFHALYNGCNPDASTLFHAMFCCPLWSSYLDTQNVDGAGHAQIKAALAGGKEGRLTAKYDIRQISRDSSRKELPEEKRKAIIEFPNLYPLLNSVPVMVGGTKNEGERKGQGERKAPAAGQKNTPRGSRNIPREKPSS